MILLTSIDETYKDTKFHDFDFGSLTYDSILGINNEGTKFKKLDTKARNNWEMKTALK